MIFFIIILILAITILTRHYSSHIHTKKRKKQRSLGKTALNIVEIFKKEINPKYILFSKSVTNLKNIFNEFHSLENYINYSKFKKYTKLDFIN